MLSNSSRLIARISNSIIILPRYLSTKVNKNQMISPQYVESEEVAHRFVTPVADRKRINAALSCTKLVYEWYGMDHPSTVLEALKAEFKDISDEEWEERSSWGGAHLNGRPANFHDRFMELDPPYRLEYYPPLGKWEDRHLAFTKFNPKWILHHSEDGLLVVFKPDRLPTKLTKAQLVHSLHTYLEKELKMTIHCPSRLDVGTSGLILMSTSKPMNKHLAYLFQGGKRGKKLDQVIQKRINKEYLFATQLPWPFSEDNIVVNRAIGAHAEDAILRSAFRKAEDSSDAKSSITTMKRLTSITDPSTGTTTTYVLAKPITGRTHQIRLHAASLGLPIVGDAFYSGAHSDELNLMCFRLSLFQLNNEHAIFSVPKELLPKWLPSEILSLVPDAEVPPPYVAPPRQQPLRKKRPYVPVPVVEIEETKKISKTDETGRAIDDTVDETV